MGQYMSHRTVILVTHHVSLCLRGASYVVALDEGRVAASGTPIEVIRTGVLGDELSEEGWMDDINASEEAATNGPIPVLPTTVTNTGKDGAGKLTQEEKRAQGSVDWAVYGTYYYASGGFFFWVAVVLFFCLAQGAVLGQDYWIKVWSSAYTAVKDAMPEAAKVMTMHTVSRASELHSYASVSIAALMPSSVLNFATEIKNEPVNVGYYLGIYFLIGMGSLILTTLRSLVLFMGSLKASRKIHSKLLDRILSATVRFYDTTPLGRVVNRFSSDLETIDQAIAPSLSFLLYSIIATIYVVILVSVITPAFIVPGIFIALLFKSIGTYYLNTSRDMKRLNSVSRSPIYVQFNETINGVATIRAFGAQKRFIQENFNRIDSNNRPFIWMWATNRWLHCRVDVLGAFVGFCTGAVLIMSRDWVNAGLAGLSLSYSLTFTHHVLWVVRMYAMNEMNMNALERVHEYLEIDQEPAAHIEATKPQKSWPQAGSVKVENLVVQYAPDTPAVLRNISFETRPREKIGIVGRTGSGKSTLALSIFRFMEPTSGHVFIDGVDIHTLGLTDLRAQLTIIPQDPVLFSGTLRSNLDPFNEYDDAVLWAALKRSHLVDDGKSSSAVSQSSSSSTESISLDSLVTENGSNWSQGQRQLIALARALVKRTALIILDEATSSVGKSFFFFCNYSEKSNIIISVIDFDTDHQIQETIRTEFRESSLLCIAHRIKTVADYDRILVLDQGQIVEFDTPYTLMKNKDGVFHQMCERSGEYAELWNIARAKHDGEQL
jgi:ABC-type multidrug transport system fused ATPase/permease subunit